MRIIVDIMEEIIQIHSNYLQIKIKFVLRIQKVEIQWNLHFIGYHFVDSWRYENIINSSMRIFAESLSVNNTYQFLVEMINRYDSTRRSIGYLLVQIESIQSPTIIIRFVEFSFQIILIEYRSSCTIYTTCLFHGQFYYINPRIQFSLFSICVGNCSSLETIQWNIYQGVIINLTVQWTRFSTISSSLFYGKCPFIDERIDHRLVSLGLNRKNLTVLEEFFNQNSKILHWRFELIYFFRLTNSSTTLDIEINQSPKNGRCSIDPSNGTSLTLFTIDCFNWTDKDEIKDWTFYG